MAIRGDTPQQVFQGSRFRGPELYRSNRDIALLKDKTLGPGYGLLPAGTLLAENKSAAGNTGLLVPYIMDDSTNVNDEQQCGVSWLVTDYVSGATDLYVTLSDSYRFKVGDDIIFGYNNSGSWGATNGGAITAIDRTTYPNRAKISFTTGVSSASYTTANYAGCWVEASATDSGKRSTAAYILDMDVDTGTGDDEGRDAKGAVAPVLLSNAILNKGAICNYDTQGAVTDLGGVADGNDLIIK